MSDDNPRNDLSYHDALHAMQSGVALETSRSNPELDDVWLRRLKHLRVGINSAMVNDAALVRLLVQKGFFTMDEYAEELRLEANREVDRYEDAEQIRTGKDVKFR